MIARTKSEIIDAILYKENKESEHWDKILYLSTECVFYPKIGYEGSYFYIIDDRASEIFEEAEKSVTVVDEDGEDLWITIEYLVDAQEKLMFHLDDCDTPNEEDLISAINIIKKEIRRVIATIPVPQKFKNIN